MKNDKEIEILVKYKIESEEKLGDQAGGSGHLSHVSYTIDKIETKELDQDQLEILYKYTLIIETEFTYYPDNPPYEYYYEGKIIIDKNNIESEIKKAQEIKEWKDAQDEINRFLSDILFQIEWNYGDNRSPFKYPPKYYTELSPQGIKVYNCDIETDFGDNDEILKYQSHSAKELINIIKKEIPKRFNLGNRNE